MKTCPYCSAEIEDSSRFCLYCMTSLEPKKVIKGSKNTTNRWHISIAAFLVVAIFAVSLFSISEGKGTPTSSSGFSQNETSFYLEDSSETTSSISHSSKIEQIHSNSTSTSSKNSTSTSTSTSSKNSTSTSTSTSSKNSTSASTSTSSKNSSVTSTSSKESTSTSSDETVSTQPETSVPYCTYSLSQSGATLLSASNAKGEAVIPSSLGGYPLTAIGTGALSGCNLITGITLPSTVKEIGLAAFRKCSALKSINIPEGVTVLNNSAFSDCSSLVSITLPRSLTTISKNVFEGCDSLTTIYFSGSRLQKENLIIGSGNDVLLSADWQYTY